MKDINPSPKTTIFLEILIIGIICSCVLQFLFTHNISLEIIRHVSLALKVLYGNSQDQSLFLLYKEFKNKCMELWKEDSISQLSH